MTSLEALNLLVRIINGHKSDRPLVIAIDGRSASGKSTFAQKLMKIHTDDFYRPRNIWGQLEITAYDGNFDIDRFKSEVLDGILSEREFTIGIFDCGQGCISHRVKIPKSECYIIEGAYSLDPKLTDYADIKLFFDASLSVRKKRIADRNGIEILKQFESIWIPAEERYIEHYNIISSCDLLIDTTEEHNG